MENVPETKMGEAPEPEKIRDAFDGFDVVDLSFGAEGYECELTKAFEVLLTPRKVEGVRDEEFFTPLPDVVLSWTPKAPDQQLGSTHPTADNAERTSPKPEIKPGRIIRRASRRSSILQLVQVETAHDGSIECAKAGPSEAKVDEGQAAPASEESSKSATVNPEIDINNAHQNLPSKDSSVTEGQKQKAPSNLNGNEAKPPKPKKLDSSGKCSSKPAHDPPFAEQCQRYFKEVPSRFHTFPTKRPNNHPPFAAKKKFSTVPTPMPGRSSNDQKENEPKDSACRSKACPPLNLAKVSTKFNNSSHSSKPATSHKDNNPIQFNARPVSRSFKGSNTNLPRASLVASVVLEECDGKTTTKTVNTHVGVPQSGCPGSRKLKVKPFSFVERDQQARKLREQKLRQAFEESIRYPKFTATPLPSYLVEKANTEASSSKHLRKTELSNKKEEKGNLPSQD